MQGEGMTTKTGAALRRWQGGSGEPGAGRLLVGGALLLLAMQFALRGSGGAGVHDAHGGTLAAAHFALAMLPVVVSMLVVITAWHAPDGQTDRLGNSLIVTFTMSALLDFLHVFSFLGMQPLLHVPGEITHMAAFFWLGARWAELLGFVLLLTGWRLPGLRHVWLLAGVAAAGVAVALYWLSVMLLPASPSVEQRLGKLLVAVAYLSFLAWLIVAALLYRSAGRCNEGRQPQFKLLAQAGVVMSVAMLAVTRYPLPSGWALMLGHVLEAVACAFVFRAIYLAALWRPYEALRASKEKLEQKRVEYRSLVDNMPLGLLRMDAGFRLRYANHGVASSLGRSADEMNGASLAEILPAGVAEQMLPGLQRALQGEQVELEYDYVSPERGPLHRNLIAVPERDDEGVVQGVLAIIQDVTERVMIRVKLDEAARETHELRAALDAHAIVAVTDQRGVIRQVNDKFCEISGYSREELLGNTHRIINSGYHPPSFFREMWSTIGHGKVWIGEICNRAKDGQRYWVQTTIVPFLNERGKPSQYIAIRADITQRKEAEQEAQRLAFYDVLTGLPNRRMMMERLVASMSEKDGGRCQGALAMIDIDHFKEINDTLGHQKGDELLQQTAQRLAATVRADAMVARLGGDEFVVLMCNLGQSPETVLVQAADYGERIREALAKPYQLGRYTVTATPSIGMVIAGGPGDSVAADELLRHADIALYKAKENGRNTVCFFDAALQAEVDARAGLLADLRQVFNGDQLSLYYQPIVDVERQVVGVEALLRWRHPQRGIVSPALFIPLAEQANLILQLGIWGLTTACMQIKEWESCPLRSRWTVAVNVSARQLHDPGFVASVEHVLERIGVDPSRLRLELTESLLQTNLEETIRKMQLLRQRGVRFSLDDFGTGYSSLNYLKRLPLDQFKIDAGFVRDIVIDPDDAAIAQMILALAGTLGIGVVAEGVEEEAQFALLCQYGCRQFQGYLFGKPLPAEQMWIQQQGASVGDGAPSVVGQAT